MFQRLRTRWLGGTTEWLNAAPLGPAELRARRAGGLLDVHLRQLAAYAAIHPCGRRTYRDPGLVVIGAHTPEIAFPNHVAEAYVFMFG